MRAQTRQKFNRYRQVLAQSMGVENVAEKFSVTPNGEQRLYEAAAESSEFLQRVNILYPVDQMGEAIGIGADYPITGRTDTSGPASREASTLGMSDPYKYNCVSHEADTKMPYQTMDQWATKKDFSLLYATYKTKQMGRDLLRIGWNGTSIAATTDRTNNPDLSDVNKGWLSKLRERDNGAGRMVMDGLKIGPEPGADFPSLDACIDAMTDMLPAWRRADTAIEAMVGINLARMRTMGGFAKAGQTATEIKAMNDLVLSDVIGQRRASVVPFFPVRSILLAAPAELGIYIQEGSTRRYIIDKPEKNAVVDYTSSNVGYTLEGDGYALLDNIQLWNPESGAWE